MSPTVKTFSIFSDLSKNLRIAKISAIFSDFSYFEIKPEIRDVLAKMREISKMRDFPHDCGTVATYCITTIFRVEEIFAIFANLDFARNFPPAKIISTANGISRNFPPAKFSSPRN